MVVGAWGLLSQALFLVQESETIIELTINYLSRNFVDVNTNQCYMNTLSFKVAQETANFLTCIVELDRIHSRILDLQYERYAVEDTHLSDSLLEGFGIIETCLFDFVRGCIEDNIADLTNDGDVMRV